MSRSEIWLVWDYVAYELRDSTEPRLVCAAPTSQTAHRIAHVMNDRTHPDSKLGYRYDYRAEPLAVPMANPGWTDENILHYVDPTE